MSMMFKYNGHGIRGSDRAIEGLSNLSHVMILKGVIELDHILNMSYQALNTITVVQRNRYLKLDLVHNSPVLRDRVPPAPSHP